MTLFSNHTIEAFDFFQTPLCLSARKQLSEIQRQALRNPNNRTRLFNKLLLPNHFDMKRGLHVPMSTYTEQKRMLAEPYEIVPVQRLTASALVNQFNYFSNALALPPDYLAADFSMSSVPMPTDRSTNAGLLIVTVEFDGKEPQHLEEQLHWLVAPNGNFQDSQFAIVDKALRAFNDYRGFCAVMSGNKSVHFHFIFNTEHLYYAPSDLTAEERWRRTPEISATMREAHDRCWDAVNTVVLDCLKPSTSPDVKMKNYHQWRRNGWAVRTLLDKEDDTRIFGAAGTQVPQMVLKEVIIQKKPRGSEQYLLDQYLRCEAPVRIKRSQTRLGSGTSCNHISAEQMLAVQSLCAEQWSSEFPKPVVAFWNGDHFTINFKNSETDNNPSSVSKGDNTHVLLCGHHGFADTVFSLPDGMTANELADYVCGNYPQAPTPMAALVPDGCEPRKPTFKSLKAASKSKKRGSDILKERLEKQFSFVPSDASTHPELAAQYRDKLPKTVFECASTLTQDVIIQTAEGAGKTRGCMSVLTPLAFDRAINSDGDVKRFLTFAHRAYADIPEKCREFLDENPEWHAVPIQSFAARYAATCESKGLGPTPGLFLGKSLDEIQKAIFKRQPDVFRAMEATRIALWKDKEGRYRFDAGMTALFMPHALVKHWDHSQKTRLWHHPEYQPFQHNPGLKALNSFVLSDVVYDEPVTDEFIHNIDKSQYDLLASIHEQNKSWKNQSASKRLAIWNAIVTEKQTFQEFDALMRVPLNSWTEFSVDFNQIPFGLNAGEKGLYRYTHGQVYYIAKEEWAANTKSRFFYLTTEDGVTKHIKKLYADANKPILSLSLVDVPGVFDKPIPCVIDSRAQKQKLDLLAQEIQELDPEAIVIANGLSKTTFPDIYTTTRIKGVNGLNGMNIYYIATMLSPGHYAKLNVMGQFFNHPNIIIDHYRDTMNQCLGRNVGFRKSYMKATKTAIICSEKLQDCIFKLIEADPQRIVLYKTPQKIWRE